MDDFKLSSFGDYNESDEHIDLGSIDGLNTDYFDDDLHDGINNHEDLEISDIKNMNVESDIINLDSKLPDLEKMKLTIRCDVGEIMLSLNQIISLTHGTILDLDSLPPKVTLNLNNRQIASGILVELNGRLGVRVVEKSL